LETIAIHSIKKHKQLEKLGIKLLRKEKKFNDNFHVYIYEKTIKVVEVLNANTKHE
jgi:hypothetical protein